MLEIKKITKVFSGLEALKDVSMNIEDNKITAIVGPNGAGKTTLFNIIAGVFEPTSGEVIFDGKNITGLKSNKVCELGIARTYQIIKLFNKMSVIDNVIVGMHSRTNRPFLKDIFHTKDIREENRRNREEAEKLLNRFNLLEYKNARASSLSYGQQRLLEIARALASKPKIIMLDEPAAGMNSTEKVELDKRIKELKSEGFTIIIVEHDMKLVASVADYMYVINFGKNLADGIPKDVLQKDEVVEAYIGKGNN